MLFLFGSTRILVNARRGCSHHCQVVESGIGNPSPCVSPKCFDVLRHFAMGSRLLTLPPLGSGGYDQPLKSAKSLLFRFQLLCLTAVILWLNATISARAQQIPLKTDVTALAFSTEGNQLLVGSTNGVQVWDWPRFELSHELSTECKRVNDLQFSPDGATLLIAGGQPAEKGTVEIWNWTTRSREKILLEHDDVVYRVAWSKDGKRWASASHDKTLRLVETDTAKSVRIDGHSKAVFSALFFDDNTLVSSSLDQSIRLWSCQTHELTRTLDQHSQAVTGLIKGVTPGVSSAPIVISISDDKTVRMWQPTIGRMVRFVKLSARPLSIVASLDGTQLFVGTDDGHIAVIQSNKLEWVRSLPSSQARINELILVPDGRSVICGGPHGVEVIAIEQ